VTQQGCAVEALLTEPEHFASAACGAIEHREAVRSRSGEGESCGASIEGDLRHADAHMARQTGIVAPRPGEFARTLAVGERASEAVSDAGALGAEMFDDARVCGPGKARAGVAPAFEQGVVLAAGLICARVERRAVFEHGARLQRIADAISGRGQPGLGASLARIDALEEAGVRAAAGRAGFDRTEHRLRPGFVAHGDQRGKPVGMRLLIVVEPGDELALRQQQRGVAGFRHAGARRVGPAERHRRFGRQRSEGRQRGALGRIVDCDEFSIGDALLREDAARGACKRVRAAEGGNQNANARHVSLRS